MFLREDGETIGLSVEELVTLCRRKLARITSYNSKNEHISPSGTTKELCGTFEIDSVKFSLFGHPDAYDSGEIINIVTVESGQTPKDELVKQVRGELFILGYLKCQQTKEENVSIRAVYRNKSGEVIKEDAEEVSLPTLEKFYRSCLSLLQKYGAPEIDRVRSRSQSCRSIKFPYDKVRDGQSELVKQVYRSIAKRNQLFVSAPTGTGKTVSVIYPAIRAVGDGRCERIFYLTPKTTIARAAGECISLLASQGLSIRAVRIIAKERICRIGTICRKDRDACKKDSSTKLSDAVLALYSLNLPCADENDVRKVAEEFDVCPYELSLCYSELCEVVICDVNYVFDPAVHLKRYFDGYSSTVLLIDEAHNLVSRAREMYSEKISTYELREICSMGQEIGLSNDFREGILSCVNELERLLLPYLSDNIRRTEDGSTESSEHLSYIPSELYGIIDSIKSLTEKELFKQIRSRGEGKALRVSAVADFSKKITKLSLISELFDNGFRLFLFMQNGNITVKLFAIDTGNIIREKLTKIHSAVFFSATLEPFDYYRDALGGERGSDFLSVKSPFDPSSLSVTIMDKISTRISEREKTRDAVCRVIAATLSAKRGHYMVYAPSFEYADMLYRAFTAKYPKIKALIQAPNMTVREREAFINSFESDTASYLVGFSVLGGVYSEGIDLSGESLIGAIVVGIGMPSLSYEGEAIAEYYDDKLEAGRQYAYIYPGMNKVFQAAGRVIRREGDRGVIVLIDDRFSDPIYKKSIPDLWKGMRYSQDPKELRVLLDDFWRRVEEESAT